MSDLDPITTSEQESERDATLAAVLAAVVEIVTNPALDDPDDEVFFAALKPMIELGGTEQYKRHFRKVIVMPEWKSFTDRHGDRLERIHDRILAYKEELRDRKQKEAADAE